MTPRDFDDQLLVVGKDIGADELDDLHQAALLLKELGDLAAAGEKIVPDVLGIPGGEVAEIFAVALGPVDGRIMAGIGQGFVQSPETAGEALGVLGDRFGKVAPLGRDGADDGDAPLGSGEGFGHAGPLVKFREAGGQIGGKPLFGGHFLEASGDFAECFGPAGGGIGHDGHMVAHGRGNIPRG